MVDGCADCATDVRPCLLCQAETYALLCKEHREELQALSHIEVAEQRLDRVYGNLALSTDHKPDREAFRKIALLQGMSNERFAEWADKRQWWTR